MDASVFPNVPAMTFGLTIMANAQEYIRVTGAYFMTRQAPVAAVTGASGYLGSRICSTLELQGCQVARLVRSTGQGSGPEFAYDLAEPVTAQVREVLQSADALIHAAYDLSLISASDIWRVNVEGRADYSKRQQTLT